MVHNKKIHLGLIGFENQKWLSVGRTIEFYLNCLRTRFRLSHIPKDNTHWFKDDYDAVINLNSELGWKFENHPNFPIIFIMNGGLVLDQEFLHSHIEKLEISDGLIVNCESDIAILEKMVESCPQIIKLPLPINTDVFQKQDKHHARDFLPIQKSDYIMGYVGRILPQKNLHVFLRALAEIKQLLYPKTIAGIINGKFWGDYPVLPYVTDTYPKQIQMLIENLGIRENCYYFPDHLSDSDLSLFYNSMDILLHPTHSLDENFGYVPLEAMSCGIPPIASDYGGLKDTILHEKTGFLSPTWVTSSGIRSDIRAFIIYSLKLLNDKKLYSGISNAAQDRVHNFYTQDHIKPFLVDSIFRIIKDRKATPTRSLKLKNQKPHPKEKGLLPTVTKPWEHYYNVVSYYVSNKKPSIKQNTILRGAAPLSMDGDNTVELLDAAWPLKKKLNEHELRAMSYLTSDIALGELMRDYKISQKCIEGLIQDGFVLISNVEG